MDKAFFILEWTEKNGKVYNRKFPSDQESQAKNMNESLEKKGAKGLLRSFSCEYTGTRSISWI